MEWKSSDDRIDRLEGLVDTLLAKQDAMDTIAASVLAVHNYAVEMGSLSTKLHAETRKCLDAVIGLCGGDKTLLDQVAALKVTADKIEAAQAVMIKAMTTTATSPPKG